MSPINSRQHYKDPSGCVRCGACKALCPTYSFTLDETMGARGRVAMLGAIAENELSPTKRLSDKIFSCILCEACRDLCPAGINIPEAIYQGRTRLKDYRGRGRFLAKTIKFSLQRMDSVFSILGGLHKLLYSPLYNMGKIRYVPEIAALPFKNISTVYKKTKKIGRVSIFAGCSMNYFYTRLGDALLNILLACGYEVVVLKGEVCCGAPLRALGFEKEAVSFAEKNIELFNKMNVEAILSICPTCTMTIRNQYPLLTGSTIKKIMDVNEFFAKSSIAQNLKPLQKVVTYHDPCHLRYGLGIKNEPREILRDIPGVELVEMRDSGGCCGFGGFFSMNFRKLSKEIGTKKFDNACATSADTIVTSCPGCMTQLEDIRRSTGSGISIKHIVEVIDEALRGQEKKQSEEYLNSCYNKQ